MTDGHRTLDWPPHASERRPWRQRVARGPRADRRLREITVSLPPHIAGVEYPIDRSLAAMCAASAGDLTSLDLAHGRTLASLNPVLLRAESVASDKIEDIESAYANYGRALLGARANASSVSMAASTAALARMISDTSTQRLLSVEAILRAHHALMRRNPEERHRAGRFRTTQNWIGGSDYAPNGATHVPPPPETVPHYIADLVEFANRDDLPPLAQAAIVHAQFESIHPFIDGNGRIGRTLVHAVLRRRRVTRHLTVPLASGLVAHRERYFAALNAYCQGSAADIISMLAAATTVASAESARLVTHLEQVRGEWQEAAGNPRPGTVRFRLLDTLTSEPAINTARVHELFGLDDDGVRAELGALEKAGVVTRVGRWRRMRVWVARAIIEEITNLDARTRALSREVWDRPEQAKHR